MWIKAQPCWYQTKYEKAALINAAHVSNIYYREWESPESFTVYAYTTDQSEIPVAHFSYEEDAQKYLDKLAEKLGAEAIKIDND